MTKKILSNSYLNKTKYMSSNIVELYRVRQLALTMYKMMYIHHHHQ